ncbi:sulfotransferase family protein [Nocardiopsis alborubida]|uniref:Sulfotransferase n=1 Tax=Nocardiopsis alborubida TaxID=146802 RepID=A0A7X6MH31_9ACTN|nr:sulfotransferase family protein [Nocardiopsis alborubida]NKZ01218.1 sulfotransferase [Nocardiopsis alborubida]
MDVIGAGFPRTGTTSMKAALERLGFGPCHHMSEVLGSSDLAGLWAGVADTPTGEVDWARLLEGWRSGVDWPLSFFWRELADAFPDARVLLTVRDPHRWYESMRATIFEIVRQAGQDSSGVRVPQEMDVIRPLMERMWLAHFGVPPGEVPDEATAVAAFERHAVRVCAEVPADRLLVYRVGEGWERLCAFLGTDVPDEPFPRLNDTEEMRAKSERWRRGEPVT